MKYKTLIQGYQKYGFQGNDVKQLIRWLFLIKKIHVGVNFCTMRFPKQGKEPSPFRRFWGIYITHIDTDDLPSVQSGVKTFTDPEDAEFDALRKLLPSMYVLKLLESKK